MFRKNKNALLALLGVILITSSMLNMESITLFVLVSYLTSHFSKNLNIIVGSGLLASVAFSLRKKVEGFAIKKEVNVTGLTKKDDNTFELGNDITISGEKFHIYTGSEDENCTPLNFNKKDDKFLVLPDETKFNETNFKDTDACTQGGKDEEMYVIKKDQDEGVKGKGSDKMYYAIKSKDLNILMSPSK